MATEKPRPTREEALAAGLCADCRRRKRWKNPAGVLITRCFTCKEKVYGKESPRHAKAA